MYAVEPKSDCPHVESHFNPDLIPAEIPMEFKCSHCDETKENWICLQCYERNCSRYVQGHAGIHSSTTRHCIAVSLSDFSIWCYECESYIKSPVFGPLFQVLNQSKFGGEVLKALNIEDDDISFTSKEVLLPHNPLTTIRLLQKNENDNSKKFLKTPKWKLVEDNLLNASIKNANDLMNVVAAINPNRHKEETFGGIVEFFGFSSETTKIQGIHPQEDSQKFFDSILPKIIQLALELPHLFPLSDPNSQIPLLIQGETNSVTLSRRKVASLLANAFLCTFPDRQLYQNKEKKNGFHLFPQINFCDHLWKSRGIGQYPLHEAAKIQCIINYFDRIVKEEDILLAPERKVVFKRRSLDEDHLPDWKNSKKILVPDSEFMCVSPEGSIEDAHGMLQVDFANQSLGGGVLLGGCVQEEIRFAISPELIVGMLFCAFMDDNEVILIKGAEKFSENSGYAFQLRYKGNYQDATPINENGVLECEIVAMDALCFMHPYEQFQEKLIVRELNKAYCGFFVEADEISHPRKVATGNWGCGAFRGDKQMKSMIQLMAAAECGRPISYYSFGDQSLSQQLTQMLSLLNDKKVTVGQLGEIIMKFNNYTKQNLFEYIRENLLS